MSSHFMLWDLVRTSEAVVLFPLVVLVPGYVLGWLLNILLFRQRMLLTRFAIAVPLSIGICPIISYTLWRIAVPALWVFYAACALVFAFVLVREGRQTFSRAAVHGSLKRGLPYLFILGAWAIIATLALIDLQIGDRLYFPTVTYDYALRTSFTSAITRTGVPPHNPYFFAGQFFNLKYHYLWFVLCSVVQQMAGTGVSPRQAMLAGTVWCGIGLILIVALYMRFFQSKQAADIDRRALIGIGLLAVTGLDIFPVLIGERLMRLFLPSIEWWNIDTVMAWVHAVTWLPHHVAGLIACLIGFLVLWDRTRLPSTRRGRIPAAAAAGLMFASAAGLSVYVTLVFAVFLTIWTGIVLLRRQRDTAGLILLSAVAGVMFSMPWFLDLFAKTPGSTQAVGAAPSTFPFQFAVRRLSMLDAILGVPDSGWRADTANLLLLPVNYLMEMGFFLIAGVIQCKRMWRDRGNLTDEHLCGFTMAATGIVICTFFRSSVISNNDLGWRGILVAQFVLLLWGADLLADGLLSPQHARVGHAADRSREWNLSSRRRRFIAAILMFGVAGSVYEVAKVRFFPLVSDTTSTALLRWISPDRNLGARTFALRQLYDELKRQTPANAVFQSNPDAVPQDNFHGMYADRQLAAGTSSCGVVFGGDPGVCRSRIGEIEALFQDPKAIDPAGIDKACRQLSIDVLVVKDTDEVWKDRQSWVWHRTPMLANDYARAFDCGSGRGRMSLPEQKAAAAGAITNSGEMRRGMSRLYEQ